MTMDVRKGMPETRIGKEAFRKRFFQAFYDPEVKPELDRALELVRGPSERRRVQ